MATLDGEQLREHLAGVAKDAVENRGLDPDAAAREKIDELVGVAADAVERDGEGSLDRVDESFRKLGDALGESHPAFAADDQAFAQEIGASHVEAALIKFCPGFYPFC
jgi:predicted trehalose synthase